MKRKKWFSRFLFLCLILALALFPLAGAVLAAPIAASPWQSPAIEESPPTILQVVGTLAIIFMLSFLVETLVEAIFGEPINHIPKLLPFKWTIMYLALGVGVLGAFVYQFDFIYLLGRFLELPAPPPVTTFGIVVTGLAIGRGSNYIHQVIMKYFPNNRPTQPGDLVGNG